MIQNRTILVTLFFALFIGVLSAAPDPVAIIKQVDKQLSAKTRRIESTMVIHGKRNKREITSLGYTEGMTRSYTEYLSPARDKGTKMLKLEDEMWIYSPSTDRTIMISGHMMRQSVMGSDLSYEDLMDDRELLEIYEPSYVKEETIDGRPCHIIKLTAKVTDIAYASRLLWVDVEYVVPLRQQLFAKSGEQLKEITLSDVQRINGRWFPMKMNYKDMLKDGKGTDWIVQKIAFEVAIPASVFTKASLRR